MFLFCIGVSANLTDVARGVHYGHRRVFRVVLDSHACTHGHWGKMKSYQRIYAHKHTKRIHLLEESVDKNTKKGYVCLSIIKRVCKYVAYE